LGLASLIGLSVVAAGLRKQIYHQPIKVNMGLLGCCIIIRPHV
jgi:hypothetical protein